MGANSPTSEGVGLALPVTAILAAFCLNLQVSPASDTTGEFADYSCALTGLIDPADVAVGPDDRIYVADTGNHCIRVFDSTGKMIETWGSFGSEPGKMHRPSGIAVAADGRVFVSDTANQRIQVRSPEGKPLAAWGAYGHTSGLFNTPKGIAVDTRQVYVADVANGRVQVFSLEGRFQFAFGAQGWDEGQFIQPVDLTLDDTGHIYVLDASKSSIQKFDSIGRFQKSWGTWGAFPGSFAGAHGIDHHDGLLYVADSKNQRIQVFALDGEVRYQWGRHAVKPREGAGKFHYPRSVAVARSGDFVVACEPLEDRCQVFTPRMEDRRSAPAYYPPGSISHYAGRIDAAGPLLIALEPDTFAVQVYRLRDRDPILVSQFGGHGRKPGQFIQPSDVVLDATTWRVHLSDWSNQRLQTFELDYHAEGALKFEPYMAQFVKSLNLVGTAGSAPGGIFPLAVTRDADGNSYVLDGNSDAVFVFDSEMRPVRGFAKHGTEPGELNGATDLALDTAGKILYIVDALNYRVQAFGVDGKHRFAWGRHGADEGEFQKPFGIAAGRDGFIYITDTGSNRVQKFDRQGRFIKQWGTGGLGRGEFHKPLGIAQDDAGRVIVVDFGNHRGQMFTADGEFIHAFGSVFYTRFVQTPEVEEGS